MTMASSLARQIKQILVGCVLASLMPTIANSAPILFRFDMPIFTSGFGPSSAIGATSTLDVLADNGNASVANQSFLNTDIFGYSVTIPGFGAGAVVPSDPNYMSLYQGSQVYITTDAAGIPTLDLSTPTSSVAVFESNTATIQLATGFAVFPILSRYSVSIDGIARGSIESGPVVVAGSSFVVPPVAVSAPTTLSLLLLAGGILGIRSFYRQPKLADAKLQMH